MVEILAALSASAAAGMRIALPLLVIGLMQNEDLWSRVPLLSNIPPQIVVGILAGWSFLEVVASKRFLGQRVLQIVELFFTPIVGALMGITVAKIAGVPTSLIWIIGIVGGLLALVLRLVQIGWFYRLRGIPLWVVFIEDALCVCLVVLAFDAPKKGGLIALMLLWLAIRSSKEWQRIYRERKRHHYQEPD